MTEFLPAKTLEKDYSVADFVYHKSSESLKHFHKSNKAGKIARSKQLIDDHILKVSNTGANKLLKDNEKAFRQNLFEP